MPNTQEYFRILISISYTWSRLLYWWNEFF